MSVVCAPVRLLVIVTDGSHRGGIKIPNQVPNDKASYNQHLRETGAYPISYTILKPIRS